MKIIIFPILFFAFLGYFLQSFIVFSPDVGYLLYAAKLWFSGGRYVTDIFETNPPMIFYLYAPIWVVATAFQLDIILIARIYTLLLASMSSLTCFFLLKKIVSRTDKIYFYSIFFVILFALFILPLKGFLQREHLLLIVLLPYLMLAMTRLQNQPVHPVCALFIGIFAAVGFALKPFFLITFCLIEIYIIFKKRNFLAFFRIESIVIVILCAGYLWLFWMFEPDYFTVILPLVLEYYFPIVKRNWVSILALPTLTFCIAVIASYFIFLKYDQYRTIGTVLFLALIGMTVAFFIARTPWFYHILPALSLALILVMHFIGQTIHQGRKVFSPVFLAIAIILYPGLDCVRTYRTMLEFTKNHPTDQMATYINSFQGVHSVFCLTTASAAPCFPLVYKTNSIYAGRYPALWWYTGIRLAEKKSKNGAILQDKKMLVEYLAEDLNRYHTRWIIVDDRSFNWLENKAFNIIDSFSENGTFREAFEHYSFKTQIEHYRLYERVG